MSDTLSTDELPGYPPGLGKLAPLSGVPRPPRPSVAAIAAAAVAAGTHSAEWSTVCDGCGLWVPAIREIAGKRRLCASCSGYKPK